MLLVHLVEDLPFPLPLPCTTLNMEVKVGRSSSELVKSGDRVLRLLSRDCGLGWSLSESLMTVFLLCSLGL